jgi:hypothetical protein
MMGQPLMATLALTQGGLIHAVGERKAVKN